MEVTDRSHGQRMIGLGDASVQRGTRQTELAERLVLDKMQERLNM